jgi:hypothetical protein
MAIKNKPIKTSELNALYNALHKGDADLEEKHRFVNGKVNDLQTRMIKQENESETRAFNIAAINKTISDMSNRIFNLETDKINRRDYDMCVPKKLYETKAGRDLYNECQARQDQKLASYNLIKGRVELQAIEYARNKWLDYVKNFVPPKPWKITDEGCGGRVIVWRDGIAELSTYNREAAVKFILEYKV